MCAFIHECIITFILYDKENLIFLLFICKFKLKFTEEMLHIKQTVSSLRDKMAPTKTAGHEARKTRRNTMKSFKFLYVFIFKMVPFTQTLSEPWDGQ